MSNAILQCFIKIFNLRPLLKITQVRPCSPVIRIPEPLHRLRSFHPNQCIRQLSFHSFFSATDPHFHRFSKLTQIIDMPDSLFVLPKMATDPALQSTWSESTSDIGVVAGAEQDRGGTFVPSDSDFPVSFESKDEEVGPFPEIGREHGGG